MDMAVYLDAKVTTDSIVVLVFPRHPNIDDNRPRNPAGVMAEGTIVTVAHPEYLSLGDDSFTVLAYGSTCLSGHARTIRVPSLPDLARDLNQ